MSVTLNLLIQIDIETLLGCFCIFKPPFPHDTTLRVWRSQAELHFSIIHFFYCSMSTTFSAKHCAGSGCALAHLIWKLTP